MNTRTHGSVNEPTCPSAGALHTDTGVTRTRPTHAVKRTGQLLATTTLALLLATGLAVAPAVAQTPPIITPQTPPTLSFGASQSLLGDNGTSTNVAMNAFNKVIEVHQAGAQNFDFSTFSLVGYNLWYHVGWVDSNSNYHWNSSTLYDTGYSPHIALNDHGFAVEVHQAGDNSNTLWYHVATLNPDNSLNFSGSTYFDHSGSNPTVALNNSNVVVEEHISTDGSSNFWSHEGILNPSSMTVTWYGSQQTDNGENPQIALNDSGKVVEVHNEAGGGNLLYYRVGQVNGGTIDWGPSTYYDSGYNASVAITSDGLVVETHAASNLHGSSIFDPYWVDLYKRTGVISGNQILWSNPVQYDSGAITSIACNYLYTVETHTSDDYYNLFLNIAPTLWYHLGSITRQ